MGQLADLAVVAALGWLAAMATGWSPWLTILVALVICRPLQQPSAGLLWKKPTIRLALLTLLLIGLLANWSSYCQGVEDGFNAAAVSVAARS